MSEAPLSIVNAMTVDVEEYFHASVFNGIVKRKDWDDLESRVCASTERLLRVMTESPTGPARLKGLLPAGTAVAHKTGTMGGTTNDGGVVTLPDGAGHVAIAVFVKGSTKEVEERERVIAEIARTVYDYFLLAGGGR